jgi:hypothetical protein
MTGKGSSMKITSRHDIEAPATFVFETLADFDSWERSAMRRGADVMRTDKLTTVAPGLAWMLRFRFRGKDRKLNLRLNGIDAPSRMSFVIGSPLFDATAIIDLMELGAKRTRIVVVSDAQANTLAARLILQSLKLARSRVQRKVDGRIGAVAQEIEDRYRAKMQQRGLGLGLR